MPKAKGQLARSFSFSARFMRRDSSGFPKRREAVLYIYNRFGLRPNTENIFTKVCECDSGLCVLLTRAAAGSRLVDAVNAPGLALPLLNPTNLVGTTSVPKGEGRSSRTNIDDIDAEEGRGWRRRGRKQGARGRERGRRGRPAGESYQALLER